MLTKDVKFTYKGQNHTASWKHIEILYKFDKNNEVNGLRCLPTLRDEHIYVNKMKKMKVSIAAQVFSQRVAATLRLLINYGKYKNLFSKQTFLKIIYFTHIFQL